MRRLAFTLVEALVVFAVIGILLALLLPAVNAVRESSRRMRCIGNLNSIGIALHSYLSANGMFPSAHYANLNLVKDGTPGSSKRFSVFTHLLPHLDHSELYGRINFACEPFTYEPASLMSGDTLQQRTAVSAVVSTFLCPSDLSRFPFHANVNYRASLGVGPYLFEHRMDPLGAGAFGMFTWLRGSDFADGLGNTIAFSEKLTGDGDSQRFDVHSDFWYTNVYAIGFGLPPLDNMVKFCDSLSQNNPVHFSHAGYSWVVAAYESTLYNHTVTPNSTTRDCSAEALNNPPFTNGGVMAARSRHNGGVNVLTMDGAAHFVTDGVSLQVWRALATRSGNDSTDGFRF